MASTLQSVASTCQPPGGGKCPYKSASTPGGIDAFALVEAGGELDIDRVLIDLGLEAQFQSTGNLNASGSSTDTSTGVYGARPIVNLGPALRVGYRFW